MPAGDWQELKDNLGNLIGYTTLAGEFVPNEGLALGASFAFSANATMPASATLAYLNATPATSAVLTIPAAQNVAPGRVIVVKDNTNSASATHPVQLQTPASGGKIDGTAANTATTATPIAILAAYGVVRLMSDGVNWNSI
jgi:hypothetical protein